MGHKKPSPQIFQAAAARAGVPLADAWVIGDSPHADIGGAVTLGLRSVWVANGHSWNQHTYRPTHIAAVAACAIHHAVRADSSRPAA